jgi:serine/threonine protein kinase
LEAESADCTSSSNSRVLSALKKHHSSRLEESECVGKYLSILQKQTFRWQIGGNKVKLCDLGLATVLENKKRMTVCGTNVFAFYSPHTHCLARNGWHQVIYNDNKTHLKEIIIAETYDSKVDVFSFGIVLTEMITSQPPRQRGFENKFEFDVATFQSSLPETCPPEFAKLVVDCTKQNPVDRPTFKGISNACHTHSSMQKSCQD